MGKAIADGVRKFMKPAFNRALVALVLLLGIAAVALQPQGTALPSGQPENGTFFHFFYLSTCPHCHEQMEKLHPVLEKEYGLKIAYHEVGSQEGRELFGQVCDSRGLAGYVPTTLVGNRTFAGYSESIGREMTLAVAECAKGGCADPLTGQACGQKQAQDSFELPFLGKADGRTVSLPLLAAVLGLIDGFNPCAMWVLVYLISLVMTMNDRKRIFLVVGSFVLASGVLYFLFMSAWLNAFLLVGYMRPVTVLIGMLAVGGGVLGLKEFWEGRKGGLKCKVTDAKAHAGLAQSAARIATAPLTIATLAAIVALAFVVNSVEFVCSSAIPAVFTQILSLRSLGPLEYYGYILLYDLFFMLDDLAIFGLAAFAVSGSLGEKYAAWCRLAGGALMLALGAMLLFAPGLLA